MRMNFNLATARLPMVRLTLQPMTPADLEAAEHICPPVIIAQANYTLKMIKNSVLVNVVYFNWQMTF